MAPSDRDLAERFIAERLAERRGHGGVWHGDLLDAAAILDTPGVVVATSWSLHGPGPGRLVIELPIEPSAPVEPVKEEK